MGRIHPLERYLWICLVLLYSSPVMGQGKQTPVEFTLINEENGVSLYERWITIDNSDKPIKTREVMLKFVVKGSIYSVLELIKDARRAKDWQTSLHEYKVINKRDTTIWEAYAHHNVPWPVSDQDHHLLYRLEDHSPNAMFISFESVDDIPEKSGVMRIHIRGSWKLERLSKATTKVTYTILSKPANLPRAITDPIVRSNMFKTMRSFIQLLEK